jgi:hypothetical protein
MLINMSSGLKTMALSGFLVSMFDSTGLFTVIGVVFLMAGVVINRLFFLTGDIGALQWFLTLVFDCW